MERRSTSSRIFFCNHELTPSWRQGAGGKTSGMTGRRRRRRHAGTAGRRRCRTTMTPLTVGVPAHAPGCRATARDAARAGSGRACATVPHERRQGASWRPGALVHGDPAMRGAAGGCASWSLRDLRNLQGRASARIPRQSGFSACTRSNASSLQVLLALGAPPFPTPTKPSPQGRAVVAHANTELPTSSPAWC